MKREELSDRIKEMEKYLGLNNVGKEIKQY